MNIKAYSSIKGPTTSPTGPIKVKPPIIPRSTTTGFIAPFFPTMNGLIILSIVLTTINPYISMKTPLSVFPSAIIDIPTGIQMTHAPSKGSIAKKQANSVKNKGDCAPNI